MEILNVEDWLSLNTDETRTVLVRVKSHKPPTEQELSKYSTVYSYGDGVVCLNTSREGLRDILRLDGVLSAELAKTRKFCYDKM